uniref:Rhotekin a n=1 Tax=Scleropages formosus TaxID=113540 RepID=A0A8C9RY49_SCLFO
REDARKGSDIQKKIDYEIRMRDGACKLLAACSQRDQALEASKSLLTCNARIMAYMSELQRMKEAQVMQRVARRSSDAGPMDDRLPCKGKVAISDLRIPLMWKDTEYFKNKGELHRCAVFCLLQLGREIYDTDMVMVDRTLTDICFDNSIVFHEASPGFKLRVELYSCCVEDEFSVSSAPRKLASKLSSSLGRSAGRKMRAAMEPGVCGPVSNGGSSTLLLPTPSVPGPKYHLLAHTTLVLAHVQDSFRTHDLSVSGNEECTYWLPLYGSVCCRLAAQPHCMTEQMMSGSLKVKQHGGDRQNWTKIYGVLKGTNLFCYRREEDIEAKVEPVFTIAVNKETRIRASEKDPQSKAQSISITNRYGGEEVTHAVGTESREDTQRWMEAFWQQFYDMSQWKQCCDDLMKIDMPSPRKPAIVTPKQGSLYHEMGKSCHFVTTLSSPNTIVRRRQFVITEFPQWGRGRRNPLGVGKREKRKSHRLGCHWLQTPSGIVMDGCHQVRENMAKEPEGRRREMGERPEASGLWRFSSRVPGLAVDGGVGAEKKQDGRLTARATGPAGQRHKWDAAKTGQGGPT